MVTIILIAITCLVSILCFTGTLNGDKLLEAFLFRQGIGLGKLPGKAVGNADISGFPCFHDTV